MNDTPESFDAIAARQQTFLATKDGYQPGAIISSSWGYDQTNIDFYRIEKRVGKLVDLLPIAQLKTPMQNDMVGTCVPTGIPKDYDSDYDVAWGNKEKPSPVFRRKLRFNSADGSPTGLTVKYGFASLWNAKPVSWTAYA